MIRVPEESTTRMLLAVLAAEALTLRLYTAQDGEEMVELVRPEYRAVALQRDAWFLVDEPSTAEHPRVKWTFRDGPEVRVRGYFVTYDTGDPGVAWWEAFPEPQAVELDDDRITVVPRFSLREQTAEAEAS